MDIMMLRAYIEDYINEHTTPRDDVETYIQVLEVIVGNACDVANDVIHRETKYKDMNLSFEIY